MQKNAPIVCLNGKSGPYNFQNAGARPMCNIRFTFRSHQSDITQVPRVFQSFHFAVDQKWTESYTYVLHGHFKTCRNRVCRFGQSTWTIFAFVFNNCCVHMCYRILVWWCLFWFIKSNCCIWISFFLSFAEFVLFL